MDSLKGWIVVAVGLSFGAGLTTGVAGSRVQASSSTGSTGSREVVARWEGYVRQFRENGCLLDARQNRLLWLILEKHEEEERDVLDRQMQPEAVQTKLDAIGAKTNQRIDKILDPAQRAMLHPDRQDR